MKNVGMYYPEMSLEQLNIDGEALCGAFFIPFFIRELLYSNEIILKDVLLTNTFVVINVVGNIVFSYALNFGLAGRV